MSSIALRSRLAGILYSKEEGVTYQVIDVRPMYIQPDHDSLYIPLFVSYAHLPLSSQFQPQDHLSYFMAGDTLHTGR